MSAGESKTFTAELAGGQHAGMAAEVLVTVNTVKVKELPELDDDFAQAASEFDTVGELRASTRKQMEAMRKAGQAGQARERAAGGAAGAGRHPAAGARRRGRDRPAAAEPAEPARPGQPHHEGLPGAERPDATAARRDFDTDARRSVKAQFILDKLAADEEIKVTAEELSTYVAEQAYRMGVAPDRLAKQLSDNGQLGLVAGDVLRSNALRLLAERARIVDEAGRPVYVQADEPELDTEAPDEDDEDEDESASDDDCAQIAYEARRRAVSRRRAWLFRGAGAPDRPPRPRSAPARARRRSSYSENGAPACAGSEMRGSADVAACRSGYGHIHDRRLGATT